MPEEFKLSHRSRKRVKEVKRKARPGLCLCIIFPLFFHHKLVSLTKMFKKIAISMQIQSKVNQNLIFSH